MNSLNKEKILENEIENIGNNIEYENAKREKATAEEVVAFKKEQLSEIIQILLERGFTLEEIKELTE